MAYLGMENQTEKIWTDLKDKLSTYVELKWHLWRLMAIERAAGLLSSLSHALILILFLFFSFLFLFVALGFFLGEWLGSMALGFLIVSMLYFILAYFFVLSKENICLRMMNVFIKLFQLIIQENHSYEKHQTAASARTVARKENGIDPSMSGIGTTDEN